MSETKEYIGDSVYVDYDDCQGIVLTTENGIGASNTIFMEPAVYLELVQYVARHLPKLHELANKKAT